MTDEIAVKGPLYCWGQRGVDVAESLGLRATPIGAPYLYLNGETHCEYGDVLVFPMHWAEGCVEIARYCKRKYGEVTFCVHPDDFDKWLSNDIGPNCRIKTAGPTTHAGFLLSLRDIIRSHRTVVTGFPQTAAFYAAYEGIDVILDAEMPRQTHNQVPDSADRLIHNSAWVAREFPDGISYEAAARELGTEFMLSSDELRQRIWP